MGDDNDRPASAIEQHIGTILQVAVVGLLAWSLLTTVQMQRNVDVLQVKLEAIQATLAQGTADRYRGADAQRDFKAVWDELYRMENRLARVEGNGTSTHKH